MSNIRPSLRILKFVGIPESVLTWKPKLPSRNWCIFLSISSSITALYAYDRRECKRIMDDYKKRVEHFSNEPIGGPDNLPRRVRVYAALSPEYDEPSAGKFFKLYIKPILNVAAIDYVVEKGNKHGAITNSLRERIQADRREGLGLEEPQFPPRRIENERDRKGGVILIGRHTVKEYLAGLAQGWKSGLLSRDLNKELQDVLPKFPSKGDEDKLKEYGDLETIIPILDQSPVISGSGIRGMNFLTSAPAVIPPQPPLLLVPFTELVGFKQVPAMIAGFFNHRERAKRGGEAAMKLIFGNLQKVEAPYEGFDEGIVSYDEPYKQPHNLEWKSQGGTLCSFDKDSEDLIKNSFEKVPDGLRRRRKEYYANLSDRLKSTRNDQDSKEKSEDELFKERLNREKNWREEYEGWALVRKYSRMRYETWMNGLQIFV